MFALRERVFVDTLYPALSRDPGKQLKLVAERRLRLGFSFPPTLFFNFQENLKFRCTRRTALLVSGVQRKDSASVPRVK